MYDKGMTGKRRLSASVDAEVVDVAHQAVAEGRADNLSAWVNDALHLKADHDGRLRALEEFISEYEAEHGEITDVEIREASRRARGRAVVVRGQSQAAPQHPGVRTGDQERT